METITRICLIGPECTGKTTLAERLAARFRTTFVPEYAREYALPRANQLSYDDVEPIARGCITSFDVAAGLMPSAEPKLLFLDTDLISTVVYSRHYYGDCPPWIVEEARRRRAALYLLMDTDVPWIPDPARDSPGDLREDLFDQFRAALDEFEATFVIVSGTWDERFARAVEAVERAI